MPLAESANLRAHVFTDASKPHLPSVMPPAISNRFTKVSSLSCLRIESPASYGSLSHIHNKQQPPERTSVAFCSWRLSFRKAIRKSSFSSDNTIATSPERITQSHASIDRTRDCRATSPQPSAPSLSDSQIFSSTYGTLSASIFPWNPIGACPKKTIRITSRKSHRPMHPAGL